MTLILFATLVVLLAVALAGALVLLAGWALLRYAGARRAWKAKKP